MQPQSGLDQLSETGERIDSLLSARRSLCGPMAQQRGEDSVALVTNLYGAGLERLLEVLGPRRPARRKHSMRWRRTSLSPGYCWYTA